MTQGVVLSPEETVAFWDDRHRRLDDFRSGGDVGRDARSNQLLYTFRLGRLLEVVGDQLSVSEPMRLLDAGCGKGWFARSLAKFGHRVDGIDSSEHAIEHCTRIGGGPRYTCARLSDFTSPYLYDVVYSVDVMFHLVEDDVWIPSVRNLASLVRLAGRLVVSDWNAERRHVFSNYQVCRPARDYVELLEPLGLSYDGFLPFQFRRSPVGYHYFTRSG